MSIIQTFTERFKPRPTDVNGIDIDPDGTYVIRVRKTGDSMSLTGIETFDAIDISQGHISPSTLNIPAKTKANYAAICLSTPGTTLKLLTQPGNIDAGFEEKLTRNLGLPEDATDRIGYTIVSEGARSESRVLAVGLPEPQASNCMSLFSSGLPAPWTLEASPVAALTAFASGPVQNEKDTPTIGLIDFRAQGCTFSIFHKKSVVLLRQFDFGMNKVFQRITSSLNVDLNTANNILADGAFDISDLLSEIMQPLFSQLIVSREFIERRENCSMQGLYLSGEFASSQVATQQLEKALNVSATNWDPFDIPNLSLATDLPPELDAQRWRFASALGAAIAVFEENA